MKIKKLSKKELLDQYKKINENLASIIGIIKDKKNLDIIRNKIKNNTN